MKTKLWGRFLSPVPLLAVCGWAMACQSSTEPGPGSEPEAAFDHRPNHKGKGGGDPTDPKEYSANLTLRDGAGDRITSDGGPYLDEVDGVDADIRNDGLLLILIAAPSAINLDLGDPVAGSVECGSTCRRGFGQAAAQGVAITVWVVDDYGAPLDGQLLGMEDGATVRGTLKLGFFHPPDQRKAPRFSVRFQDVVGGADIDQDILTESSYLEVRRSGNVWTITAPDGPAGAAGDLAVLFSQNRTGKALVVDEGTYNLPFEMDVDCTGCP